MLSTVLALLSSDIGKLIIIVIAVLAGSGGFVLITKRLGLSLVNVALTIVVAVKTALYGSELASSKVSIILDLVIQALSYVQAICDDTATTDEKVTKAMEYITNIASQFGISITDAEVLIIEEVLSLGFIVMSSLGVTQNASFTKLYLRMSKYADTSVSLQVIGLKNIRR